MSTNCSNTEISHDTPFRPKNEKTFNLKSMKYLIINAIWNVNKEPVPFVFSASDALGFVLQAHHCRSMVPCQDSPSIKHTYYAQVTHTVYTITNVTYVLSVRCDLCFVFQVSVPKDLVAVMSAVRDGQEVDPQDSNRVVYRFRQPVSHSSFSALNKNIVFAG